MRRLVAAGGLAIAACVCGLLFSGAASARQASDSITVTAVVNGTTMTFTVSSSPVSDISFFGGSNWHFMAASSSGGNCSLTLTNGGAFCSYATPVTSFNITTTFSGPTPTVVAGGVGFADTSTGTFSAPVTHAGVCDWTVAFLNPPGYAHWFPIDYRVVVANAGSAPCDAAPLTITLQSPLNQLLAIGTSPVEIPGLSPGESYTASFAASPRPGDAFYFWLREHYSKTPSVGLVATMPLDPDKTPVDETDHASTKLLPEAETFEEKNHAFIDTGCPTEVPGTQCAWDLFIVIFVAHSRGTAAVGHVAAARRPLVLGSVHGTIKRGNKGLLRYKLNKTGRQLLRKAHKLPVRLIGTRKQGVLTTLIKGHLMLR